MYFSVCFGETLLVYDVLFTFRIIFIFNNRTILLGLRTIEWIPRIG